MYMAFTAPLIANKVRDVLCVYVVINYDCVRFTRIDRCFTVLLC